MNLITHLKELEARIYAADAHEAPKHVDAFKDALYEAWPKLLAVLEEAIHQVDEHPEDCQEGLIHAVTALEGDTDEVD